MDSDLGKDRVKSGIGRSRHRDNASGRRESGRIPKLSESIEAERRKNSQKSKKRRRIIVMIIAECFMLLFLCGYGFVARRWNMIQRVDDWVPEEVENPNFSVDLPQYQKQKGHWGIYIFGVDSRGSNVGKDTNADVNMICDINHDTGEIRLVSVFRDSYLNIDDNGSYNKINRAYFDGGPSNAAKMLNKNLDLNISDFVTFSWKAVADGINLLGGVDMEISRAEFAYINSFITETVEATGVYSQHLKQPGMNHLDGVQAVAYGRLRLMDTDFARTERQRKVIQAAFEKAKKADLNTLNQLTLVLFPQVATSVDMQDIISLLGDVGKYYIGETGGFPFARGDANMGRKGACVIPQTLEGNVMELHQFLYGEDNYIPSDTVKKISARISSDTGMYSQGVSVGHVSTAGGVAPGAPKASSARQETAKTRRTEGETEEESQKGEEGESKDGESKDGEDNEGNGRDPDEIDERDGGEEDESRDAPSARRPSASGSPDEEDGPSSVILPPGQGLNGSGGTRPSRGPEESQSQGTGNTPAQTPGAGRSGNASSGTNPSGNMPSGNTPSGTNPSGTSPSGTNPSGSSPSGTNPSGDSPSGTNPSGSSPSGTNPSGNSPSGTNPSGSSSSGTNPSGSGSSGTDLSGSSPSGTNPSGNSPSGTNPSGINPSGSSPSGTNPSGTSPSGNIPSGTNPSGNSPANPGSLSPGQAAQETPSPNPAPDGNITTIPVGPGIS